MAIIGSYIKQPREVLDYDVNFSEWIPTADYITSVTTNADAGITLGSTIIDPTTKKIVKQWVSDGTSGAIYKIQMLATTAGGRKKEVEFNITVREY